MRNDLSGKASQANMDIRLNEKADPSYVNTELAKKADNSDIQTINTEFNKKRNSCKRGFKSLKTFTARWFKKR